MNRTIINKVWSAATLYKKGSESKSLQNIDALKQKYPEQVEYIDRLFNKHLGIIETYGF